MKTTKKILAVVLSVMLLLSVMPFAAFAGEPGAGDTGIPGSGIDINPVAPATVLPTVTATDITAEGYDTAYEYIYANDGDAQYANYYGDITVSFDRAIEADDVVLAGAYDNFQSGAWTQVALRDLAVGEEFRIVKDGLVGSAVKFAQLIAITGGDFRCAAKGIDVAGVTMTVKFNLYETKTSTEAIEIASGKKTYTFPEVNYVAEVNGTGYATLAEAIAAAGTGATVTLLDDVTVDSPVVVAAGKDIKFDLDGHSLSGNIADADGKKLIQVSGKLEFVGENGGCIYNTNVAGQGHAACQALTGGTVIVNAPIHFGDSDTDMTNANAVNRGCGIQNNGGTLIINNGYYTSIDANYSTGAWAYAILNCAGDTTVNNATVYGNALHGALGCEEGTFTVNGGNFTVSGANNYYSLYCDGGAFIVNGGTFTNSSKNGVNYVGANSSTTITGGDFTYSAKTPFVQSSSASNPVVSGGTFSAVVPEKCCAPGFEPVTEPNAQGKYTVEPAGANNGVSLTIGEDITSNYYVDYTAYAGATKVVYTYNSISEQESKEATTDTVYLDDIPAAMLEGGRLKITVAQAPAQMAETTEIKIMNADEVLDTLNYSSKTYCDNIIAMDDDALAEYAGTAEKAAQLKTLCNTIIAYGYAAQGVFADYETTAITTADFSTAVKNQIDAAWCDSRPSAANAGQIRFTSVSFACTKDARLRFYMDTSAATYTPEAPAEETGHNTAIKYIVKDGVKQYFIEVSGIDAVDFDKPMVVNYGGSSISCSVLDFCSLAFTHGDNNVQNLARTLIVYNQNAEAYFG